MPKVYAIDGITPERLIDRLQAHCLERLGRIKQPECFVVWPEIPRTAAGKLVRRELRSRIVGQAP